MFYWSSDTLYPCVPSLIPINVLLVGKTPSPLQTQKMAVKTIIKDPQNGHFGICCNHICWDCIIETTFGKLFDVPNKNERYIYHTAWLYVNWAISVPPQHADCKHICDLGAFSINGFLQTSRRFNLSFCTTQNLLRWFFFCMAMSELSVKPVLSQRHRWPLVSVFGGR